MTPAAILTATLMYGPSIIPLIQQLAQWIADGKTTVTADDWAILNSFAAKKATDYLK